MGGFFTKKIRANYLLYLHKRSCMGYQPLYGQQYHMLLID